MQSAAGFRTITCRRRLRTKPQRRNSDFNHHSIEQQHAAPQDRCQAASDHCGESSTYPTTDFFGDRHFLRTLPTFNAAASKVRQHYYQPTRRCARESPTAACSSFCIRPPSVPISCPTFRTPRLPFPPPNIPTFLGMFTSEETAPFSAANPSPRRAPSLAFFPPRRTQPCVMRPQQAFPRQPRANARIVHLHPGLPRPTRLPPPPISPGTRHP